MADPKRRQFLRVIGVTGTIGLAGCQESFTGGSTSTAGSGDSGGNGNDDDSTSSDSEVQQEDQVDGDGTAADAEISATPVIRLDDELPDDFKNAGASRQSNNITAGASGDYVWEFDGESYIRTDYTWGDTDHSGTLASWVYLSPSDADIGSPRYLLSACDSSPQVGQFDELSLMQAPDAGIGIRKIVNGDGGNTAEAFASDFPTDQWFHLAGVVDKDANEVRVYVNGDQKAVGTDTDITMEYGTEFGIGAQAKTTGGGSYQYKSHFAGKLDDVRIYDTALAPEDIPRVY